MSAKIYNGLRSTVADPFDFGIKARAVMEDIFFRKAEAAVEYLTANPDTDLNRYFGFYKQDFEKGYDWEHTVIKAVEQLRKSATHTFSDFDFGYQLALIPNAIPGANPLVLIYSAENEYEKALKEAGLVEDYGYWDNSDPDEDVSEEQWDERKKAWGYLLDDNNSPASVGIFISNPEDMAFSIWRIMRAEEKRATRK